MGQSCHQDGEMRHRLFLSAEPVELGEVRAQVAEILESLGFEVVYLETFREGGEDLRGAVRGKVDGCVGLVQLVGARYGVASGEIDEDSGPLSYSQYEGEYARRMGKPTVYVKLGAGFLKKNLPPETGEQQENQRAYREMIAASGCTVRSVNGPGDLPGELRAGCAEFPKSSVGVPPGPTAPAKAAGEPSSVPNGAAASPAPPAAKSPGGGLAIPETKPPETPKPAVVAPKSGSGTPQSPKAEKDQTGISKKPEAVVPAPASPKAAASEPDVAGSAKADGGQKAVHGGKHSKGQKGGKNRKGSKGPAQQGQPAAKAPEPAASKGDSLAPLPKPSGQSKPAGPVGNSPAPIPAANAKTPAAKPVATSKPATSPAPRRNLGRVLAVAALLALVLGGATWLLVRDRDRDRQVVKPPVRSTVDLSPSELIEAAVKQYLPSAMPETRTAFLTVFRELPARLIEEPIDAGLGQVPVPRDNDLRRQAVCEPLEKARNFPPLTLQKLGPFLEALTITPRIPTLDRARALFLQRKHSEAERVAKEFYGALPIEKDKTEPEDYVEARVLAGCCAVEQLQPARAVEHFEAAVKAADPARNRRGWAEAAHFLAEQYLRGLRAPEALPVLQKVVGAREELLGPEDPRTLASRNNLGYALFSTFDYAKAEAEYTRVLLPSIHALGGEHPQTMATESNLAQAQLQLDRLQEAEENLRHVLAIREKTLGADHPWTLSARHNMAHFYVSYGTDQKEFEKLARRAMEDRERVLGTDHVDTLESVEVLAMALESRGAIDEAEKLYRRVVAGTEKVWGPDDSRVLAHVSNLADLLVAKGDLPEGERLTRRVLEGQIKALGKEHATTLLTEMNLGMLLMKKGELDEAEKIYRHGLAGRVRIFGREHKDNLAATISLVVLEQKKGDRTEVLRLLRETLEDHIKTYGAEHQHTYAVMQQLVTQLITDSDFAGAAEMERRSLPIAEKLYGKESAPAAAVAFQLAKLLIRLEKSEGVAGLLLQAQAGFKHANGEDHPTTKAVTALIQQITGGPKFR